MSRPRGPAVWLNEYHGDFLVSDRLEEARRAAAHRHLVTTLRSQRRRYARRRPPRGWGLAARGALLASPPRLTTAIVGLGRRLRALL